MHSEVGEAVGALTFPVDYIASMGMSDFRNILPLSAPEILMPRMGMRTLLLGILAFLRNVECTSNACQGS